AIPNPRNPSRIEGATAPIWVGSNAKILGDEISNLDRLRAKDGERKAPDMAMEIGICRSLFSGVCDGMYLIQRKAVS
ncbi:hypothetical protein U1Q18_015064, partial [Sarracenia purpurea var. burkii]